MEAGLLIPLGPSQAIPAPSTEAGTYVDGAGKTDVRFKDGKHQVKAGDKTVHLVTDKGNAFRSRTSRSWSSRSAARLSA